MTISNKVREQMLTMCQSICDDDGLDPRKCKPTHNPLRNKSRMHRQLRLCRQVYQRLSLVLPAADDAGLRPLTLESVRPGKQGSCLTVRLCGDAEMSAAARDQILARLRQLEGWLRSELAATVTRKRVPHLQFELSRSPCAEVGAT